MKVLLLNQDWFAEELRSLGFEVKTAGHEFARHLEHTVNLPMLHIDRLIQSIPGDFVPDCIVALDNSAPIAFTGLDETTIPTIFYGVDAHHHVALHRYLNEIFDYSFTAQKDYIPLYEEWGQQVEWMPLWASRHIEPSYDQKEHGAVFIGTLNKNLNPERVAFFDALREKVPVLCTTGCFWEYFPLSEIVINQTVKLDLNFRVFEAMMSGALLLTEHSQNGLLELFEDGAHLVTYQKNNVEQAAELIQYYSNHPEEARRIGKAGRDLILEKHTPLQRAQRLADVIRTIKKKQASRKFQAMAINHLSLARSAKEQDPAVKLLAVTAALKSFEYSLEYREPCDAAIAAHLMIAAHDYDKLSHGRTGYELLKRFSKQYSDQRLLSIGALRSALNFGEHEYAESIREELGIESLSTAYSESDKIMRTLLDQL